MSMTTAERMAHELTLIRERLDDLTRLAAVEGLLNPNTDSHRSNEILRAVCDYYRVSPKGVQSHSRSLVLSWPRQVWHYLACTVGGYSQNGFARLIKRDHAGVSYNLKTVRNLMQVDPRVAREIRELEAIMNPSLPKLEVVA